MIFSESLKKNSDFQRVYKEGKSYANKYLVMYILKRDTQKNRIGISVSKKVGNSVVRHRLTRLIRESYRLNEKEKAVLMLQKGKISIDEIQIFFPELSDDEIEEVKREVMQLA